MILSAYCIYSYYLVKEFIIASLNMSESAALQVGGKAWGVGGGMVAIYKLWWFSQRKMLVTVTMSCAGAIGCLDIRGFHLIVILWAMRQGEINKTQMAENCAINPVREFTFTLSDNINHSKRMLKRLHLFLMRNGVYIPGFTSQPRESY